MTTASVNRLTTTGWRVAQRQADGPQQAVRQLHDVVTRLDRPERVDGPELVDAMVRLRQLRDELARWEPALIGAARERGLTWNEIAPALGLASRQAAERRYLRLNPQAADTTTTTREDRVQAARNQRSGDRAVAAWARKNAADLRRLAGRIADLDGIGQTARKKVESIRVALGADDAADLVGPLSAAGPSLRGSHPALADQINAIDQAADEIRSADRDRRSGIRDDQQ
jgi:hypothetical protein